MFGKRKQAGRPVENENQQESVPEQREPANGSASSTGDLTLRLVLMPKDPPRRRDESKRPLQ